MILVKLVILGFLPLTTFLLALRADIVAKLVLLGVSPLTSSILAIRAD